MQGIFRMLYDFPRGLALALFFGFYLFLVFVMNIFVVIIETIVLRKMFYGSLRACFGASFLVHLYGSPQ